MKSYSSIHITGVQELFSNNLVTWEMGQKASQRILPNRERIMGSVSNCVVLYKQKVFFQDLHLLLI